MPRKWYRSDPRNLSKPILEAGFRSYHDAGNVSHAWFSYCQLNAIFGKITMSQISIALAVWLHALAIVVFIGHYVLLSLIYLPVMAQDNGTILSQISRRSRSWQYLALLIFIITG